MDKTNTSKMTEIIEENLHLKSKLAFSIGALEGISFLLKNNDPNLAEQNLEHLRSVVNRVVEDLKKD
jgi:hypothetical protein